MTITEFLLARIAEDEAAAQPLPGAADLRALRECAAKRAIVEAHDPNDYRTDPYVSEPLLCALASVYSDHPDYQQEWAA